MVISKLQSAKKVCHSDQGHSEIFQAILVDGNHARCALVLSGHCFLLWIPVQKDIALVRQVFLESVLVKSLMGVSLWDIMDVKLIDFFVRYVIQPPKTISQC